MSVNKHVLSVYSLWTVIISLHFCAYSEAKPSKDSDAIRLQSSHRQNNRQEPKRDPSSVHTNPDTSHEKLGRPTVGGQTAPAGTSSSLPKAINSFPGRAIRTPSVLESTFSGRVEKWVGNFMPSRGTTTPSSKKLPLKTKIYIFKGKIKTDGSPNLNLNSETTKVFSVVNSNENGEFSVQLPPGEYTVFAEIEGKLYRNSFDGEGHYSTTKIEDGIKTNEIITDSSEATF